MSMRKDTQRHLSLGQCKLKYHYISSSIDSSVGKESTCNAGEPGLISGLGRSLEQG